MIVLYLCNFSICLLDTEELVKWRSVLSENGIAIVFHILVAMAKFLVKKQANLSLLNVSAAGQRSSVNDLESSFPFQH